VSDGNSEENDDESRLESTLESAIEDEQTHVATGKFKAAPRPTDSSKPPTTFETLPRSVPRPPSLRVPKVTPVPPEPLGLSGGPRSIGRGGARSVPEPPRPRTPSNRPPAPHAAEASDTTDTTAVPAARASVPDDAPTIPGSLRHLVDDDVDLAVSSGPPGIPLLVSTTTEHDAAEERRRREAARERRGLQRKGKRPTVRIPDDTVAGTEASDTTTGPDISWSSLTGDDLDQFHDEHDDAPDHDPVGSSAVDDGAREGASIGSAESDGDLHDEPTRELASGDALAPRGSITIGEVEPAAASQPIPAARRSAPVMVDEEAIIILRPLELTSDMPPVPSASNPGLAMPLEKELASEDEELEEIEPERMSLPGDILTGQRRTEPRPPPLPPARSGSTAPAPPSSPAAVKPATVSDPRLAIPGPLPVPMAPPSLPSPVSEPPPRGDERGPARSLPKPPPPPTEFTSGRPKEKRPWWAEMFEDDFVRTLDNPRLRDVERDVAFIEQSLRLPPGARILDLACGNGVHAVELAARGYQLTGLDLSTTLLDMARSYNGRRNQAVNFVQADMRQLELDASFVGIYCWGASFGYFEDAANVNVIDRVVRALKPGGRFLIDLTNRDFVAPRSPSTAWFEKPGCVCMDEVRYDFLSSRLFAKRMVIFESGRAREIEYSVRLYTVNELGILLESRGLRVTEVSGHRSTRNAYFGNESPQIIILAEKA